MSFLYLFIFFSSISSLKTSLKYKASSTSFCDFRTSSLYAICNSKGEMKIRFFPNTTSIFSLKAIRSILFEGNFNSRFGITCPFFENLALAFFNNSYTSFGSAAFRHQNLFVTVLKKIKTLSLPKFSD